MIYRAFCIALLLIINPAICNKLPWINQELTDTSMYEDGVLYRPLKNVFSDSDGVIISISLQQIIPESHVKLEIKNDTLFINPEPNWNGWTKVEISAKDDSDASITDQFSLNVIPVNDPPVTNLKISSINIGNRDTFFVNLLKNASDVDDAVNK